MSSKPIVDLMLKSGLVPKHVAQTMEKWGYLQPGDAEKVPDGDPLAQASKEQMSQFVANLETEIDKSLRLRETQLDLDKMRWPVKIDRILQRSPDGGSGYDRVIRDAPLHALIDRMGRLYFRADDVHADWFIPGNAIERHEKGLQMILEVTPLYIDEVLVCIQVSVA